MSENISYPVNIQGASTDVDPDQRDAILLKEEEEKKRLAELREQESALQKDSLNRDASEKSEDEPLEPKLRIDGDTVIVENFEGRGSDFSFSHANERDVSLLDDGTIVVSLNGNPENKYLISTNEETGVTEYDLSDLNVAELNKESQGIRYSSLIADELEYEVEFSIDREGNIEIDSVRGDAAGKINFKDGDKTLTLDKDGKLVEVEETKELEKDEDKSADQEAKDNLDTALDGADLSELQGVKDCGDDKERSKEEREHLDAALDELDLSEIKAVEHSSDERSSVPPSVEKSETSRAR